MRTSVDTLLNRQSPVAGSTFQSSNWYYKKTWTWTKYVCVNFLLKKYKHFLMFSFCLNQYIKHDRYLLSYAQRSNYRSAKITV